VDKLDIWVVRWMILVVRDCCMIQVIFYYFKAGVRLGAYDFLFSLESLFWG
jgi:hypothetical protein